MLKFAEFLILFVAVFGVLSSAAEYNVLRTPPSAGVVRQDFAGEIEVRHEHLDSIHHKLYLEKKSIQRQYAFHVSIERGSEVVCSGALVYGGRYVVTAASCGVKVSDYVRINASYMKQKKAKVLAITCVKNHPKFRRGGHSFDYDIAVLHLAEKAYHISLFPNSPDYKPSEGRVTHYSTLAQGMFKNSLIVTHVPILSAVECRKLGFNLTDNMLCAGEYSSKESFCTEDRGSPLFTHGRLIGVKTWGEQCSRVILPTVFTDVSVLQKWIIDAITAVKC